MSEILDTLPGTLMSVREVTRAARSMWDSSGPSGPSAEPDYRASQMNVVLHFGAATPIAEASTLFDRALAFAQVYPCRIVVLVERHIPPGAIEQFDGKLFSQCYLGRNLRERCCCEALMLGYPQGLANLVEHQVSLWLEADLPVYYWLHRVAAEEVEKRFPALLKQARRIIFDRAVDGAVYGNLQAKEAGRCRDLAFARTLRLRQTLGQLLSSVPPRELVEGLRGVEVLACEDFAGEAAILLDWVRQAVIGCAKLADQPNDFGFDLASLEALDGHSLAMNWRYAPQSKFLLWDYNARAGVAHLDATFGSIRLHQPLHVEPLDDAMLLAEALFFG